MKITKLMILCSLLLVSCSSTQDAPNESSDANDTLSEPSPMSDGADQEMTSASNEESSNKPTPAVSSSMYRALNEGIKNQNDDAIMKASIDILTQNPKDLRGLNSLAIVYYKKSKFEAAQFLLNKAISINPRRSELHSNLGLVYLAKNERRDAVSAFKKALEINSQDAIAAANLGAIYSLEKDYNKAALALEISVGNGTRDIKILNNYAVALTATGRPKEASEIFERIMKDNPTHRESMLNYAILLIENMQKNKQGLDLLNRLKFVGAPSEARDTIKNLENKAKAGLQ